MEVKRKPNESPMSLMRRFSRLAQQTKLVITAKSKRYARRATTPRMEKNRAIMREELRALRRRLERLGTYNEDTFEEEKRKLKQQLDL